MINHLCRSFESSSPLILSKIKVIQESHFDSFLQCLDSLNPCSSIVTLSRILNDDLLIKTPKNHLSWRTKPADFIHQKPHKSSPTRCNTRYLVNYLII